MNFACSPMAHVCHGVLDRTISKQKNRHENLTQESQDCPLSFATRTILIPPTGAFIHRINGD